MMLTQLAWHVMHNICNLFCNLLRCAVADDTFVDMLNACWQACKSARLGA